MHRLILSLLLIVGSATAPTFAAGNDYRQATMDALKRCRLTVATALYRMTQGDNAVEALNNGNGTDGDGNWPVCVEQQTALTKGLFASTIKGARASNAKEALKNYHVIFLAALQGVVPLAGEIKLDYARRQQASDSRLTEAWARFDVEQ